MKSQNVVSENYDIPITEQGLLDFIRFATAEIKRSDAKIKKLNKLIDQCNYQLTLKGINYAEHLQTV